MGIQDLLGNEEKEMGVVVNSEIKTEPDRELNIGTTSDAKTEVKSKVSSGSQPVKKRSQLHLLLGKSYFTLRRYLVWHFDRTKRYSHSFAPPGTSLPHTVATHRTPLYRLLKNVDMWLQENKVTNLRLASGRINGILIKPGETFSFWRLVGKPTKGKGYLEGMVLTNGGFKPGVGGGLCQLSNLIYWLTLHTPLTVVERWRHTHDVFPDSNRTQPFGSGATVVYNYVDLQIKNETPDTYQLCLTLTKWELQGEWRSDQECPYRYEIYENSHQITHEWWGEYIRHNSIGRKTYNSLNEMVKDEIITENHAVMMYEPLLTSNSV